MWPLNISDLPPPTPSQIPTTFGRRSSTSCHCTWRPISASSSRTRSPIACSSPVALEIETRSTARRTSRSASISTEMRQHLLPEQLDLLVAPVAPELQHHVRAAGLAVLLHRCDAVRRRPGDRLALVEDLIGHLRLRSQPPALLHRLRNGADLLLREAGEVEQRVGCSLDVLHLVREVHAGDLTGPIAPRVAIGLVDRGDDRAADVDVSTNVLARVVDERRCGNRGREAAVGDLAGKRLHLRSRRCDVHRRNVARGFRALLKSRDGGTEGVSFVLEGVPPEDAADDLDGLAHRSKRAATVQAGVERSPHAWTDARG